MTYDMARPRYTLPFAGKDYELIGTFELIEEVEAAFREGIVQVTVRATEMGGGDAAKLIAAVISSSGGKMTAKEAGTILLAEVGFGSDFTLLKIHLGSFLTILLTSPQAREEMAKSVGEAIGEWNRARSASPGPSTSRPA